MMKENGHPAAGGSRPLGLYIHIPFCVRKCLYCDFLSGPAPQERIDRYVKALEGQIAAEAELYARYEVQTVFFGGGTPSLLSEDQIGALMERIRRCYRLCEGPEITLESNPGTLDPDRLRGYRRTGINRLSMGLQSADDRELKLLGRIHTYADFLDNYAAAREAGFSNINVDLMSALPGQTLSGWLETLRRTADLGPEHISAYSLILEEGTPLYALYRDGGEKAPAPLPGEEQERLMYEQTKQVLAGYGYRRYEISNYARPGYECRHNIGYWTRRPYLGVGLGSASLLEETRWKVTGDLETYLDFFFPEKQTGERPLQDRAVLRQERQQLTETEQKEEFLFLGLRMQEGIRVGEFRQRFHTGLWDVYGSVITRLQEQGLLLVYDDGRRMRLTERGIDVSNYVLSQFLL